MRGTVAFGAALAALLALAPLISGADPKGPIGPGTDAPKLEAAAWLNGDAPKEDAFKGKVLLVEFFAFW